MRVCEGWQEFLKEVEEPALPVVCFGAGAVPWLIEPSFTKLGIWDRIRFFLDNNEKKSGTWIGEHRKVPVLTVTQFWERKETRFLVLITCENYVPILEQMQQIEEWREKCPDYEIVEWNETNYDVHQNRYMEEAYRSGKWAYVSDYARLDIIYRQGGIYLDTDVELLERLDVLLEETGFIAYGQWPAVNSGAGMGCVKGHPLVKEMRDDPRAQLSFFYPDGSLNMVQNGFYESRILRNYGFSQDFSMQYLEDMLILAPEIMATASLLGRDVFVTERTLAIHHCGGSWKE